MLANRADACKAPGLLVDAYAQTTDHAADMSTDDAAPSRPDAVRPAPQTRRLGEILVAGGAVTAEQLAHALAEQPKRQLPLGQTLLALGYTTDEVMRQALSSQLG